MREQQHHIVSQNALSQRTQVAIVIAAAMIIGWPIAAYGLKTSSLFGVVIPCLALIIIAAFRRMTVSITETELHVSFVYGWPRRAVQLNEIAEVSIHRMRAIYGWGIRLVPNGMLWRAGGHHAVRLELKNGRYLYIGSADCEALASAINERLSAA